MGWFKRKNKSAAAGAAVVEEEYEEEPVLTVSVRKCYWDVLPSYGSKRASIALSDARACSVHFEDLQNGNLTGGLQPKSNASPLCRFTESFFERLGAVDPALRETLGDNMLRQSKFLMPMMKKLSNIANLMESAASVASGDSAAVMPLPPTSSAGESSTATQSLSAPIRRSRSIIDLNGEGESQLPAPPTIKIVKKASISNLFGAINGEVGSALVRRNSLVEFGSNQSTAAVQESVINSFERLTVAHYELGLRSRNYGALGDCILHALSMSTNPVQWERGLYLQWNALLALFAAICVPKMVQCEEISQKGSSSRWRTSQELRTRKVSASESSGFGIVVAVTDIIVDGDDNTSKVRRSPPGSPVGTTVPPSPIGVDKDMECFSPAGGNRARKGSVTSQASLYLDGAPSPTNSVSSNSGRRSSNEIRRVLSMDGPNSPAGSNRRKNSLEKALGGVMGGGVKEVSVPMRRKVSTELRMPAIAAKPV